MLWKCTPAGLWTIPGTMSVVPLIDSRGQLLGLFQDHRLAALCDGGTDVSSQRGCLSASILTDAQRLVCFLNVLFEITSWCFLESRWFDAEQQWLMLKLLDKCLLWLGENSSWCHDFRSWWERSKVYKDYCSIDLAGVDLMWHLTKLFISLLHLRNVKNYLNWWQYRG